MKSAEVAGIEEGVADARGERIERGVVRDERIVRGAAGFGEVVDLQDKSLAGIGEAGDDFRQKGVFPERVVVEMPDVGRGSEGWRWRWSGGWSEVRRR